MADIRSVGAIGLLTATLIGCTSEDVYVGTDGESQGCRVTEANVCTVPLARDLPAHQAAETRAGLEFLVAFARDVNAASRDLTEQCRRFLVARGEPVPDVAPENTREAVRSTCDAAAQKLREGRSPLTRYGITPAAACVELEPLVCAGSSAPPRGCVATWRVTPELPSNASPLERAAADDAASLLEGALLAKERAEATSELAGRLAVTDSVDGCWVPSLVLLASDCVATVHDLFGATSAVTAAVQ